VDAYVAESLSAQRARQPVLGYFPYTFLIPRGFPCEMQGVLTWFWRSQNSDHPGGCPP
jgi:hypothetical protein